MWNSTRASGHFRYLRHFQVLYTSTSVTHWSQYSKSVCRAPVLHFFTVWETVKKKNLAEDSSGREKLVKLRFTDGDRKRSWYSQTCSLFWTTEAKRTEHLFHFSSECSVNAKSFGLWFSMYCRSTVSLTCHKLIIGLSAGLTFKSWARIKAAFIPLNSMSFVCALFGVKRP